MKMIRQLEQARQGLLTREVRSVARKEGLSAETLAEKVAAGQVVLLKHHGQAVGIGAGLRIKVNVNLGTSPDYVDLKLELTKLKTVCRLGADTVMDLSTGGDLKNIRQRILAESQVPVGTVPIYQAAVSAIERKGSVRHMSPDDFFSAIEEQAQEGVAFVTVHCGITLKTVNRLQQQPRTMSVVSRGGVFTICWMLTNERENPLYQHFDRLLEIARKYDLVLSLGDGLRPGGLSDATDACQIEELITLGELVKRAWEQGVQVMVEGPGHLPLNEVAANVLLEKKICYGAPFYVLGPLVTDIAPGYDHITSAIGAAVAGWHGADFICTVSPSEHLSLPTAEDVADGLLAARIAAHAADLARGNPAAWKWNRSMEIARAQRRWAQQENLSLDPEHFHQRRQSFLPSSRGVCTMCGRYCSMKMIQKALAENKK